MKTKSVKCSQCGVEFDKPISYIKQGEKRGYPNHFCSNKCSTEFNRSVNKNYRKNREKKYYKNPKKCLNCNSLIEYKHKLWKKYCSSKCAAIHTQKNGGHKVWTEEDKKKLSETLTGKKYPGKKYPTRQKIQKEGIKKECKNCREIFEILPYKKDKQQCCCRKCYNEFVKKTGCLRGIGRGGYRPNSGTSKKGWYRGIFCASSWELAWVIYHIDKNIPFERNKKGFPYKFEGKDKKYYPDFIVGDEYIEIKNYNTELVEAKSSQFPHKLKMMYKSDLSDIFDYVIERYGKDYTRLYSKKDIDNF